MLFDTKKLLMPFEYKERPVYNEPFLYASTYLTQPHDYKTIIAWIKRTPEAIGIVNAIATDILSDGQFFITEEGTSGKQKKNKAEKFWRINSGREQLKACLYDWLILGNSAFLKGRINETELKEAFKKSNPPTWVEFKEIDYKQIIDEDLLKTKKLVHVPWSTMHIDLNPESNGVSRFRQVVAGKDDIFFSPEEII